MISILIPPLEGRTNEQIDSFASEVAQLFSDLCSTLDDEDMDRFQHSMASGHWVTGLNNENRRVSEGIRALVEIGTICAVAREALKRREIRELES